MLRSRANTLVSVRLVSQRNTGHRTPGVDGQVALTRARASLAEQLHRHGGPGKALPVRRVWILDADLKAAFDRIDHNFLLEAIGTFPAREQIREWLKAGVVDRGRYAPTEEGTPQGGVITPPTQLATS